MILCLNEGIGPIIHLYGNESILASSVLKTVVVPQQEQVTFRPHTDVCPAFRQVHLSPGSHVTTKEQWRLYRSGCLPRSPSIRLSPWRPCFSTCLAPPVPPHSRTHTQLRLPSGASWSGIKTFISFAWDVSWILRSPTASLATCLRTTTTTATTNFSYLPLPHGLHSLLITVPINSNRRGSHRHPLYEEKWHILPQKGVLVWGIFTSLIQTAYVSGCSSLVKYECIINSIQNPYLVRLKRNSLNVLSLHKLKNMVISKQKTL